VNRQRLAGGVAGISIGAVALADRWILVLFVVIVFAVVCGVIFPAVWSKKLTRRRDARAVLEVLWTRRPGGQHRP
jgi:phosphotransferase system  glucose/maltose/N-acetylglucosamine-specific IIC component